MLLRCEVVAMFGSVVEHFACAIACIIGGFVCARICDCRSCRSLQALVIRVIDEHTYPLVGIGRKLALVHTEGLRIHPRRAALPRTS